MFLFFFWHYRSQEELKSHSLNMMLSRVLKFLHANAPDLLAAPPVIGIIDFLETRLHCRLGLLKKNFNLMLRSSKKLDLLGPWIITLPWTCRIVILLVKIRTMCITIWTSELDLKKWMHYWLDQAYLSILEYLKGESCPETSSLQLLWNSFE